MTVKANFIAATMRNCLILSLIFILPNIFGQSYNRLLDSNKIWNVHKWNNVYNSKTHSYKCYEDITIDERSYWRVYFTRDSLSEYKASDLYLREDTISKKVYYYSDKDSIDKLLYDFSLIVGDTISIYNDGCYKELIVHSHQSVTIHGVTRNKIELRAPYESNSEFWIEGIGSLFGLIEAVKGLCYLTGGTELLCTHHWGELIYSGPYSPPCYISDVGIPQKGINNETVIVVPNPMTENSKINYSDMFEIANVFDLTGRHVKTYRFNGESVDILKSDYKSGLYMVVVTGKDNKVYSNKLLVK